MGQFLVKTIGTEWDENPLDSIPARVGCNLEQLMCCMYRHLFEMVMSKEAMWFTAGLKLMPMAHYFVPMAGLQSHGFGSTFASFKGIILEVWLGI